MRSIKIENFKCFNNSTINFKKLTVLAGGNGAGKSTVIQSFLLIAQNLNRNNLSNQPNNYYLNDYYCKLGSSNSLFHSNGNSEFIKFTFNDKNECETEFKFKKDDFDSTILECEVSSIIKEGSNNGAISFVEYFDFIGADRLGPKSFHEIDSNFSRINVGKQGEYTALVLYNYYLMNLEKLQGSLISHLNIWLSNIFGDIQIRPDYNEKAGIAILEVKNHPLGEFENPLNMPYGISYLLPIIVSCLIRLLPKNKLFHNYVETNDENEIIIIENPEAHLHPSAQSKLGYFLAKMSKEMQIIIETHSEHIINGIRLATLEDDIDNNEIQINFFESNEENIEPNIKEIKIDEFSDLTDWPKGFFDQQEQDISTIFKSRIGK